MVRKGGKEIMYQYVRLRVRLALELSVIASLAVLQSPWAMAQAGAAPSSADSTSNPDASTDQKSFKASDIDELESVTVTARRREENAQEVPVAITVVPQQALENNNIQVLEDIHELVPSLDISQHANREEAEVSIRGQGPGAQTGQPAVSVYLNEVPLLSSYDGGLPGGPGLFFDLENVQVLKGPQGTLFGRNTMGGAVLLQSARPTTDFGGSIQVGYGNYNNRELDGNINLPIWDDKLLMRVAINGQWRDGYTDVLSEPGHPNGIDLDNRDSQSVRTTVTFHPFDALQNDTIWTYQQYRNNSTGSFITAIDPNSMAAKLYPSLYALLAEQQALGPRVHIPLDMDTDGVDNSTLSMLQNITRVDLTDTLRLRNIFGWADARFNYDWDADSTPLPIFNVTGNDYRTVQYTEELQLQGDSFNKRLQWVTGLFYLDEGTPGNWGYDGYSRLQDTLFLGTLNSSPQDEDRQNPSQSRGLYSQGTYDVSEWVPGLKVTGGVRYTWDENDQRSLGPAPNDTTPSVCSNDPAQRVNCSYLTDLPSRSSALTYTGSLDYQLAPETLLYLTSRRGYRAGGANGVALGGSLDLPNYAPEYVRDYELGVKSDWRVAGMPVRTNVDVFYQDYTNIQVQQPIVENNTIANVISNAAAARLWGAELEALANLTENLQFSLNGSYLKFEYTSFGPGVDSATLQGLAKSDRIPYQFNATARYNVPITPAAGALSAQATFSYQAASGTMLTPYIIPPYGLMNFAVNWDKVLNSAYDASFYVSNAFNRTYAFGGVDVFGFQQTIYGDPRMYGLRVRYHFGKGN